MYPQAAGVLVRVFDDMSDAKRPWTIGAARSAPRPWMPASREGLSFQAKFSDRWPATFVNKRHGGTYNSHRGGMILAPWRLVILCGYAVDGRSMDKGCEQMGGQRVCGSSRADAGCTWWGGTGGCADCCIPGCSPQTAPCTADDVHTSNAW